MSTIFDVCKLAGVSTATVSRVMNGTGQVKESTRQKVFSAMEQLGYRPNQLAQSLASNKTHTIGFVVSQFDGAYTGFILKQASICVDKAKKQLIVTDCHNDPEFEYETVRQLENRCDAIVLYSRTLSNEHLRKLYNQMNTPLVLINRTLPEQLFHTVTFAQEEAATMMMNHLIGYGHRNIACITGPLDNPTGKSRMAGYVNTLKKHAIPYRSCLVKNSDYQIEGGYNACKQLIEDKIPFTALFAFNDYMALGALKALNEADIKVPDQVSIAGIDNNLFSAYASPGLTTIELPIEAMTKKAVELAIDLITHEHKSSAHQFKGKLIQRESVKPCRAMNNWFSL
ncbi:LacI family DNA-binding transcriptional regulator [Vibrio ziniensis]|uniref:LacI family transcriptional regulator n=1 Tax=Vibrio ziniensis TaxID=2711221 RepID=A0A6G7CJI4_9VIBR|nr:LacI family DNA-binding transcriptional regulator [Vibrio ziniensis]QIH42230.1 LacI family transcriptional regulator [Vibrio ziniensis]